MGVQFGPYPTDQGTPDSDDNFGAAVDGNYGFGDACFDGNLHPHGRRSLPAELRCADRHGDGRGCVRHGPDRHRGDLHRRRRVRGRGGPQHHRRLHGDRRQRGFRDANHARSASLRRHGERLYRWRRLGDRRLRGPPGRRLPRPHRPGRQEGRAGQPDLQGHEGRGHQHRQRRPVRAPGPAAGVRRRRSTRSTWPTTARTATRSRSSAMARNGAPVGVTVPASTPIDNATFLDIGASPYEGKARPLCDTKLVPLQNGKSVVPMFNVFTDVPLPGRFFGLNNDDLTFSTDPKSLLFGEKAGIPFSPVGIYDYTNRLITTVEADYNGIFDVLLPSTNRISCPTPSGVCANVYRFVGNDPGVPGRLNLNYNPLYRTIAADFEAFPGLIIPADTAPDQVGVVVQLPGGQAQVGLVVPGQRPRRRPPPPRPPSCTPSRARTRAGRRIGFTVSGKGFGATKGSGQLTLDGVAVDDVRMERHDHHGDRQYLAVDRSGTAPADGHRGQRADARSTASPSTGIGGSYNPPLYEVGPANNRTSAPAKVTAGRWFTPADTLPATADHAIQDALNAAPAGALVVVYPNLPSADPRQNPRGAYYENLIISKRVKLQGVGPGSPDGVVPGSIIDGGAFGGDRPVATDWYATLEPPGRRRWHPWAGNQDVYDGAVISLYLPSSGGNAFPSRLQRDHRPVHRRLRPPGRRPDGLPGQPQRDRRHADRPAGGRSSPRAARSSPTPTPATSRSRTTSSRTTAAPTGRSGIGTPDLPAPDTDNQNDGVRIVNNRIIANAGTNLAGGDRHLRRRRRLRVSRQRHLRQLLGRVRRRHELIRPQPQRLDRPQPHLLQPVLRRGRRDHDRRPAADGSLDPLARLGRRLHPRQPDPGQPRQRRRRRHPVPDVRADCRTSGSADWPPALRPGRVQQHDREQRVDARRRRHRARRRAERPHLQQHDHEEHHDRDGRDEQRPAGAGRPLDRAQQHAAPAQLAAARRAAAPARTPRASATRSCSTTSSRTTGPAPTSWAT